MATKFSIRFLKTFLTKSALRFSKIAATIAVANATAIVAVLLTVTACTKTPDDPVIQLPEVKGSVKMTFENLVNDAIADLGVDYTNAYGDTFQITKLNYYVSNFKFVKTDGSEYVVPKDSCYFYIKQSDLATHDFTLRNVPAGDYKSVKFTLGIDSLKSTGNVNTFVGVLDPARAALDMYWGWNDGYIFFKLEGTSPQIPTDINGNHPFAYHIGGYGVGINNLKHYNLSFGIQTLKVDALAPHTIHINAAIDEVFKTPTTISIFNTPNVAFDPLSTGISNNMKDMFRVEHIH